MRPAAFLLLNVLGLLIIGGLLEAPHWAAAILIGIGFALPAGLAYEVRRDRLDSVVAAAAAWWSAPFVVLLSIYLADGGAVLSLGGGLACAGLGHVLRSRIARRHEDDDSRGA
jgi:heme A synthase